MYISVFMKQICCCFISCQYNCIGNCFFVVFFLTRFTWVDMLFFIVHVIGLGAVYTCKTLVHMFFFYIEIMHTVDYTDPWYDPKSACTPCVFCEIHDTCTLLVLSQEHRDTCNYMNTGWETAMPGDLWTINVHINGSSLPMPCWAHYKDISNGCVRLTVLSRDMR